MNSERLKNLSFRSKLSILAGITLVLGLFGAVMVSQKQQETRSRAAGVGGSWETVRRLPGQTGTVYGAISGSGSIVHVVRGKNGSVYYQRSSNEGTTWSSEVNIGAGAPYLEDPLVVQGSNVYAVYVRNIRDLTDWSSARPVGDLFIRISRDNGVTWEPEKQLTTARGAFRVSIAVEGPKIYMIWMDYRSQNTWDLYYRRSVNSGSTWEPEIKLVPGTTPVGAERPQIAAVGNSVHITWMDGRDNKPPCVNENDKIIPQCTEIYYKRSTDWGVSFGPNIRLTREAEYSGRPEIAAAPGGAVIVAYDYSYDSSGLEQFMVRSTDNGSTWSVPKRFSFAPGDSSHSSLIYDGSTFHIAWFDGRGDATSGIYYQNSSDSGANWGVLERVGLKSGGITAPLLAETDNYIHVIWGNGSETQYSRRTIINSGITTTPTTALTPSPTPTRIPTIVPTRTPTPIIPTNTPIPPTPTPTRPPLPTSTPLPTTTSAPNETRLSLNLLLHGLGKGGDSANPNGGGTANPLRPQRTVTVEVFNASNQLVLTKTGVVNFNSVGGNFTGAINSGTTLTSGTYTLKVKSPQFLRKQVTGIQTIAAGTVNQLPVTTLVSGDVNSDNVVNILDYNIVMDCYSDFTPARSCSDAVKKLNADITDDGNVNQFDYNLFLRELINIQGA